MNEDTENREEVQETPEEFDHARRFGGIARLYGDSALRAFGAAHVAVIGIGGVGSWVAEALARSGVGALTLIDLDHIAESNTNRQIHALDGNYGRSKVEAMAERVSAINPSCRLTLVDDFVEHDAPGRYLESAFDYIVDAIDNTRVKTALIAWCKARRQDVLTVGGAGGQTDPTRIRIDDLARTVQDPLLAKVRSRLRREHDFPSGPKSRFGVAAVYSDEPLRYPPAEAEACEIDVAQAGATGLNCAGFGSSVCVTAGFGLAAAAHVLRELAGKRK